MKLGFTGTSDLMQIAQRQALHRFILDLPDLTQFHHGDCISADQAAHDFVEFCTLSHIVIHPPNNPRARANCYKYSNQKYRITVLKPKPYLERNHDIVDATEELLACPRARFEQQRSGTWATIRYARKRGKNITLILPDGSIRREYAKLLA